MDYGTIGQQYQPNKTMYKLGIGMQQLQILKRWNNKRIRHLINGFRKIFWK